MADKHHAELSKRERQIMDVIYQRGRASAAEVVEALPDPPSYSTIRALLVILEKKGYVTHQQEGARYIYLPTQPREQAGQAALKRVLKTFYDGSIEKAVAALLDSRRSRVSAEEAQALARLIEQARKEGR
jgi:BlaI family transcriptional regulator, penicillinase repressor